MDVAALLQPRIHDRESLHEFADALTDQLPGIERNIAKLKSSPNDRALIADLFRAIHSIKGDAALCKVHLGEVIVHPIETLLGRLRNGEIGFSEVLAETVLLAMDRLELAIEALESGKPIGHMKLVELVGGFEKLAETAPDALEAKAALLIEAVTGFRPASTATIAARQADPAAVHSTSNAGADLDFFRSLALQYEEHSPLFKGRIERLQRLAQETNEVAGKPVDPMQLEAAVYMHDLGMLFLPDSLWLNASKLSDEEKALLRTHPGFGSGLLQRMPGWQAAADMVLQHHEMPNGKGYPQGLSNGQIVPGAKILAIIDTFEAVTLKHSQRGDTRSLVRAIAEINACDKQFAPEWIAAFNTVVRRMVEG
ncbi:MAG: HD domain-containing protein [Nitrosomonadales bacterium]|nr:HD domain-containing protein [Nitrosomonadales bacterium]